MFGTEVVADVPAINRAVVHRRRAWPDRFTLACSAAFDVETVTKDFFREIANWYFSALKHASFPKDAPKENDGHDHISIIRLIETAEGHNP